MNSMRFARKLFQKAVSLPSEFAFRFSSKPSRDAIMALQARPPDSGDPLSMQATAGLREAGYFLTDLDTLDVDGTSAMQNAGENLFERLRKRAYAPAQAGVHTVTATREDLVGADAIFYWGLNDRVLSIVSEYLGQPPAYDGFSAYYSRSDGRQAGPRLWHKDREDLRMVKVAVYFTDVDDASGPYEVLKPQYGRLIDGSHYENMTDERILSVLGAGQEASFASRCTGKAGTVIFSDTALHYHRGRPPTARDRCAIFYSYFSRNPRYPYFCERSAYSRAQLEALAKPLPEAKRKSVLWRHDLPLRSRLIPRNRVTV